LTYLDWFKDTFKVDQTSLVKTLCRANASSLQTNNCYEYYISDFDIYLSSENEKLSLLKKHNDIIEAEKLALWEIAKTQSSFPTPCNAFDDTTLKAIKESLQEIEVQKEIIRKINKNIHLHFESCHWHPFQDHTLFYTFSVFKLPLIKFETNYWLGILPENFNCILQNNFFSLLKNREIPDSPSLLLTKLTTWVRIEYQHSPMSSILNLERTINSTLFQERITNFRIKERTLARQKIMDNWEIIYKPLHEREQ